MTGTRLLAALGLLAATAAPASAEPGLTAATFLQRQLGAQPAGMGYAFTAVRGRLDAMQFNPAGLAWLRKPVASSTYLNGLAGANHGFLGYGQPLPWGTLGVGLLYFNAGSIDLNLADGTTGRVTAEEDTALSASYGLELPLGVAVGATYRHVRLELAETARAAVSQADLGALWRTPLRGLSVGAAVQYLGPDVKFEEAGDPPPRTRRFGVAYHWPELDPKKLDPSVDLQKFDVTVAADWVEVLHERKSPRAGLEMGLQPHQLDRVALRFGWVFNRDSESFTFGLGLKEGRWGVDYSLGTAKDLGNLQQVSLAFYFGKTE